jgi:hypothetical protein
MHSGPQFDLKIYLNGFPKSGLHLLVQYVATIASHIPTDHPLFHEPWAGTFWFDGWGNAWLPLEQTTFKIGRLAPNQFIKAHAGYQPSLERFLWQLGVAHIFIYRDFRDVAVSQAFHILDERENFQHPAKEEFQRLGGFDEVLEAVIVGHREFPGVMARWNYYTGWLDVPWVLSVKFEHLLDRPREMADKILMYCLNRAPLIWGGEAELDAAQRENVVQMMINNARNTSLSPTFRKGKAGGWRKHFTARHRELFKETDAGWLKLLGYTGDDDW